MPSSHRLFMVKTLVIDESRCNGCGLCVKACHEGALGLVDGKAKMIENLLCDGIGKAKDDGKSEEDNFSHILFIKQHIVCKGSIFFPCSNEKMMFSASFFVFCELSRNFVHLNC